MLQLIRPIRFVDSIPYALIVIVSIFVLVLVILFFVSGPQTDRWVLFTVFLTVFDVASDLNFIVDLSSAQSRFAAQFKASIAISVINYLLNIGVTYHLYHSTVRAVPRMSQWVVNSANGWSLTLIMGFLVGFNPDCVQLSKSGLLDMDTFRAPWDDEVVRDHEPSPRLTQFRKLGIITLIFKDLPKFIIKATVLATKNSFPTSVGMISFLS